MSIRPFETLERLRHRMAEALISQSGMRHAALTGYLRETLSRSQGAGALIPPPVLEGAFPFVPAMETLGDLSGTLLDETTVAALVGDGSGEGYSFPVNRHPYLHQITAWKTLGAINPQSAIVSAGTGSGKTECFLVPMLDDLYRRNERVKGVEAIMLYPLNALIASQQERLDAWTKSASGRVRYCLYNGNFPNTQSSIEQRDSLSRAPQCVPNRKVLRDDPPPLLVTNLTMLEYMLVRPEDNAIISASKGRLKWIVLDEAHTLVGSAAAEVALLLRRVMEAFEVDPSNVRFVATSATIGEGKAVEEQLRRFLADIGGIDVDQVTMITGQRRLPDRPGHGGPVPDTDALLDLEPAALYEKMGSYDPIWSLVKALKEGPVTSEVLDLVSRTMGTDGETLAMALTRAKSSTGDVLAPLRVHSFHRAQAGLWACTNPQCPGSIGDAWSAGKVLFEREEVCPSCKMPVAELFSCNDCGEAFLIAEEKGDRLEPPRSTPPADEFQFDSKRDSQDNQADEDAASEEVEESVEPTPTVRHCFSLSGGGLQPIYVETATGRTADSGGEGRYRLQSHGSGKGSCPACNTKPANGDKLYPFRFGAPFIIGNAAPMLLAAMPPGEKLVVPPLPQGEPERPSSGRQLISFTDSRQGTARMAAKLQLEGERIFVRSFIYQAVQQTATNGIDAAKSDDIRQQLNRMKSIPGWEDMIADVVRDKESELAKLSGGVAATMSWTKLRSELANRIELRNWLPEVWGRRARIFETSGVSYAEEIAQAVLLRELMRRPRHSNSVETMGLARLVYSPIESATVAPSSFLLSGGTLIDWKAWLTTIMLFSVRSALAVRVPHVLLDWIVRNAFPKSLVGPGLEKGSGQQSWPRASALQNQSQVVELLRLGLKMNPGSGEDRQLMNEWLAQAWHRLQPLFTSNASGQAALDFDKLEVAAVKSAFHCPATRRIIEIAPFGLTPYARHRKDTAEVITMPVLPVDGDVASRRTSVESDETVALLRNKGLWTSLHDRVAEFAPYSRSAEHSAQIAPARLRAYENAFKDGRINILNCSTTMEMGVDIGSVNGVLMTNVPPSIANYRQRIGRAGRRGQPLSLGFTFAKDRPLDREAFRDPGAFLKREIAAPRVALDSRPIVQRHVNAFLLSLFLKQHRGNALKLKTGEFFGFPSTIDGKCAAIEERPIALFCTWLDKATTAVELKDALLRLTRKSVLEGRDDLIRRCVSDIVAAEMAFSDEWMGLRGQVNDANEIGATKAIEISLQRLCGEYLLGDLADRGFLPGHGFPNHVVTFELGESVEAGDSDDDRRGRRHGGPQRPLDIALRDYAPGSETVVDGKVFRVGGVTLNWKRPASEEGAREIQSLRWAVRCQTCGDNFTGAGGYPAICRTCGSGDLDAISYLKPSGFLRDFHVQVHAETDRLDFIRSEPDRISAGGASWEALSAPTAGRLRINRRGSVFYHTRGADRSGYGLCLRCGRMEPMKPGEEFCSELRDHKPLRSRESFLEPCQGNNETFAIRHGLQLGHEIHTDVLEIQPSAKAGTGAANAIAIALRQAISKYLGVEPDEVGYGITPSRNAMFSGTTSIFLFDRATGGAGYVARATENLRALLKSARGLLDCPRNCRHACSSCVLVSDAPEAEEDLDRRSAMTFMDKYLRLPDIIGLEDVFAEGAEISDRPAAEIDDYLSAHGKASLSVWAQIDDPVALNDWPLTPLLHRWAANGRKITLVMPEGFVSKLDASQLLFIRDFATRHDLDLAEGKTPEFENGSLLFAHAEDGKGGMGWASRDRGLLSPGAEWGARHSFPVARASMSLTGQRKPIDRGLLRPPVGAVMVVLDTKFDCDVQVVSGRIAAEIHRAGRDCGIVQGDSLVSVTYQDRYARSPLILKLLIDTIASTAKLLGVAGEDALNVSVVTAPDKPSSYARSQLNSDLEDDAELEGLAASYGDRRNLEVKVKIGQPPHKRSLSLNYTSGASINVDLDQGFGWLHFGGKDRLYEQGQPSNSGAIVLDRLVGKVERRHGHDSQMVVWRRP